jgi:hypothetical protein
MMGSQMPGYEGTPNIVIEKLAELTTDLRFCDVGCGRGRVLDGVNRTARRPFGIELQNGIGKITQEKGYRVFFGDARVRQIPKAAVYYIWLPSPQKLEAAQRIKTLHPESLVIVGNEITYIEETKWWNKNFKLFDEHIFIMFNEQERHPPGRREGIFCLSILR